MNLKRAFWKLLGKDPEAVVVSFLSGPEPLAQAVMAQVRALLPDREHYAVTDLEFEGVTSIAPEHIPALLQVKRIGLAPAAVT